MARAMDWREMNAALTSVERLKLSAFRNYDTLALELEPGLVVLTGPNGSGKTNLLEALSLLTAGQGLRRAPYAELRRVEATGPWAVAATVRRGDTRLSIGTGPQRRGDAADGNGRMVRIDGVSRLPAALGEVIEIVPDTVAFFPKDWRGTCKVHDTIRKVYMIR